MVADLDPPFTLGGAVPNDGEVHLGALADDVERLSHLDPHALVARRVVDPVFADELLGARAVALVDAHDAGGQRHSQPVVLGVLEVEVDAHLRIRFHLAVLPTVVIGRAIVDQPLVDVELGGLEKRHLLLLVVLHGGRPVQRIQVILEEGLFREVLPRGSRLHRHGRLHPDARLGRDSLDISGHQFEPGVPIGGAALVGQRDPAGHPRLFVLLIEHHDVVGLPVHAARQVTGLDRLPFGAALQLPHQRRLRDQVLGHLGKGDPAGIVEGDFVPDPQHRAVVHRQHLCVHHLVPSLPLVPPVQLHRPAHVLLEQLLRAEQVVLVVLFKDVQARPREWSHVDRFRLDGGGDVGELQSDASLPHREIPDLAHEAEVLVVDRDGHGLAVARGGSKHVRLLVSGFLRGHGPRVGVRTGQQCRGRREPGHDRLPHSDLLAGEPSLSPSSPMTSVASNPAHGCNPARRTQAADTPDLSLVGCRVAPAGRAPGGSRRRGSPASVTCRPLPRFRSRRTGSDPHPTARTGAA